MADYQEGTKARESFERAMTELFKAPKHRKHVPKRRKKRKKARVKRLSGGRVPA